MRSALISTFILGIFFLLGSCNDPEAIIDENQVIKNHNWTYINRYATTVNIEDEQATYNIFFNLRHTADYKYSNIFVLLKETGPDGKSTTKRHEFKLANPDGEWLGKGSGNIFSYQLPFRMKHKFSAKGTYHFSIEQNMRDNPLREISDVGIRVEKAQ